MGTYYWNQTFQQSSVYFHFPCNYKYSNMNLDLFVWEGKSGSDKAQYVWDGILGLLWALNEANKSTQIGMSIFNSHPVKEIKVHFQFSERCN